MCVDVNRSSSISSSRTEIITEISKGNTSNKESYKISSIKNTPNSPIVTERLNNKSINTQKESIYFNMDKGAIVTQVFNNKSINTQDELIYTCMNENNNIDDEYHDYMDLDGGNESEIECQFEMKINKNKEKPSLPPINQDRKRIILEKKKLELTEHLVRIFTENKLKVSKDSLHIILNKNLDLFSEKDINSKVFKRVMLQCINDIPTLHYKNIKENEILKNSFISYIFLYSYIFNKETENNQSEFFIEDFSKIEKLNKTVKDKLNGDVIDVVCDNIINKDGVSSSLSMILEKSRLINFLKELRRSINNDKEENIQEKGHKYDSIKKVIEESIKKLNKENTFNKIKLSDESKAEILQEILSLKETNSNEFCKQLSKIIVDKSESKKKMFDLLSNRINDIPIELFFIRENRTFTKSIIESFVDYLKRNNIIKSNKNVDLYDKIDYQLDLIYQKIDL
ncbi:hypothetical protein ACBQ20_06490 [Proteus vulgaris]|uniref:hypothetical protein n=1 Tax=Proteus vulgaris TaxID=585 RepID=UPI003524BA8A